METIVSNTKIFHLPDLGEGLAEAEIQEWHVKEGDIVKVDQPLVCMETAKAMVEVPSPEAGKIVKLHGKKGDIIPTGSPLVEFEGSGGQVRQDKGTVVGNLEESSALLNEQDVIIGSPNKTRSSVKAMPQVRALAQELKVDLSEVKPSGPQGQITVEDVKKHAKPSKGLLSGKGEALHGVRRAMAIAMTQSHQEIVPATLVDDADVTDLAPNSDITAAIIMAIIQGVKAEPSLNAWYDGHLMERYLQSEIHVGLAMDTKEGLFVPVLKNVGNETRDGIRAQIERYKQSVKTRTIAPSELQGATISLSNFGMIAGRYATPVIVPPMVSILGCGRLRDEARVINGSVQVRRMMPLSLTFDHRAVTGGEASRFLGAVIQSLEGK